MGQEDQKDPRQDDAAVVDLNGQGGTAERDADFSQLDAKGQQGQPQRAKSGDSAAAGDPAEVTKLRAALEAEKDQHLRALAEFDNFRKRAIKERSDLLKYQGERAFFDLLDIQDNFELALKHADADPAALKQGVALIHKLLLEFFKKWEIKAESAVGQPFDPVKHNAISRVRAPDAAPGTVMDELKKVYFYKDKILRPGEVVVAAPPSEEVSAGQEGATQEEKDG